MFALLTTLAINAHGSLDARQGKQQRPHPRERDVSMAASLLQKITWQPDIIERH
jgi:hypothetical protein